ncbi:MAG: hypothetical protein M1158_02415 [Candidatus Marsarchaeota archaeon]|nr:hypothetical protein [Candidatus Marsarchaeota archaeon]
MEGGQLAAKKGFGENVSVTVQAQLGTIESYRVVLEMLEFKLKDLLGSFPDDTTVKLELGMNVTVSDKKRLYMVPITVKERAYEGNGMFLGRYDDFCDKDIAKSVFLLEPMVPDFIAKGGESLPRGSAGFMDGNRYDQTIELANQLRELIGTTYAKVGNEHVKQACLGSRELTGDGLATLLDEKPVRLLLRLEERFHGYGGSINAIYSTGSIDATAQIRGDEYYITGFRRVSSEPLAALVEAGGLKLRKDGSVSYDEEYTIRGWREASRALKSAGAAAVSPFRAIQNRLASKTEEKEEIYNNALKYVNEAQYVAMVEGKLQGHRGSSCVIEVSDSNHFKGKTTSAAPKNERVTVEVVDGIESKAEVEL